MDGSSRRDLIPTTDQYEALRQRIPREHAGVPVLLPSVQWVTSYRTRGKLAENRLEAIYDVDDTLHLVQFQVRKSEAFGRRQILLEQILLDFEPGSPTVSMRILAHLHVLNSGHPFVQAILNVPEEHAAAKGRLLAMLADVDRRRLGEAAASVGSALVHTPLMAYAAHLQRADQASLRLYGRSVLRLPPPDQLE